MKFFRLAPFLVLVSLFTGQNAPAQSLSDTLTRRVLLPDGKPVAGAKVAVRTSTGNGTLLHHIETETDENGEYSVPRAAMHFAHSETTVEAHGLAPVVSTRIPFDNSGARLKPLTLYPEYWLEGRVLQDGNPVKGATIAIGSNGTPHARTTSGTSPPVTLDLMDFGHTQSDATGAFVLRGIAREENGDWLRTPVVAKKVMNARLWIGSHRAYAVSPYLPSPQRVPTNPFGVSYTRRLESSRMKLEDISLRPVCSQRGQIRDSVTGKSVAGAKLEIDGLIAGNTTTNAAGQFDVLRLGGRIETVGIQPSTIGSGPYMPRTPQWRYRLPETTGDADAYSIIKLPRRAFVTGEIVGSEVDEAFQQSRVSTTFLNSPFEFQSSEILRPLPRTPGDAPRARFGLWLPVGANQLQFSGGREQFSRTIHVPPEGLQNMELRMPRAQAATESGAMTGIGWQSLNVKRRILLPNGSPAAFASVWLKVGDAPLLQKATDGDGILHIETEPLKTYPRPQVAALIAAPGASLKIMDVYAAAAEDRSAVKTDPPTANQLQPEYFLRGRVVDAQGRALAGVRVASISWFKELFLPQNLAAAALPAPLFTETNKMGEWTLRGSDTFLRTASPRIVATAREGSTLWTGGVVVGGSSPPTSVPPNPFLAAIPISTQRPAPADVAVPDIVLRRTITMRGRVLGPDGRASSGALVSLLKKGVQPTSPVPTAVTGNDGRFVLQGVPIHDSGSSRDWSIQAAKPNIGWSVSWMGVRSGFDPITSWERTREITLQFPRLVRVTGRVIDIDTGEPPISASSLAAWRGEYLPHGMVRAGQEWRTIDASSELNNHLIYIPLLSSGRFDIFIPSASNTWILNESLGFDIYEDVYELKLPRGDQREVVLNVQRKPGFVWKRQSASRHQQPADANRDIYNTRPSAPSLILELRQNGKIVRRIPSFSYLVFHPATHWGERIEYRVLQADARTKTETEVVSWRSTQASRKIGPIIVDDLTVSSPNHN